MVESVFKHSLEGCSYCFEIANDLSTNGLVSFCRYELS